MEILNKKERRSSFLLFLLMFIISSGILFTGIFFNYRLPWKENRLLRAENEKIKVEFTFQEKFVDQLENINYLLDSLDHSQDGFFFMEKSISSDLVDIKNSIPKDSVYNQKLYDNMILTYKKLLDSKRLLKEIESSKNEIDDLNKKIDEYEEYVEKLERALELCKELNRN